jgi:hypothetical protein
MSFMLYSVFVGERAYGYEPLLLVGDSSARLSSLQQDKLSSSY